MRKRIAAMLILLTAALLIAGAFLPEITASVMDAAANEKAGTAPMQPLELEVISDEGNSVSDERGPADETPEAAALIPKLMLASRMYTLPISDNETSMTEAEVFTAAEQAMDDYIGAGIFQWFDVTYSAADPMLGLDAEHPEDYMTFWSVYFENENEPYQTLQLYVDDETGTVFYIKYDCFGTYSMDGVRERNRELLDAFTTVYFHHVGLSEAAEYAKESGIGVETLERDGEVTCMHFNFGDVIYGEVCIEFYATGAGGFEIYFPAE